MGTSIIILTFNKLEYTKTCIESIKKYTNFVENEIIVVDNASTDGTISWLKKQEGIRCIFNSKNEGFPRGCNIGIKNSKNDNDILLLNNDTIVTENWLTNLNKCLYSDNDIGAVGPVTNSSPYYQAINVPYNNQEELHEFCKKHNVSNIEMWEERQKLIGFCMLIKRKALNKIGLLDERFSPGNYEDDDISVRLILAGYRMFLCKDTFIHHYGSASFSNNESYHNLLCKNEKKFKNKWGFTSRENMCIYKNYLNLIKDKNPKILEIYCGTGSTGLYISQNIKCKYYGYDSNLSSFQMINKNINHFTAKICSEGVKFDYIIITNVKQFINNNNINKIFRYCVDYNTKIIVNLSEDENNEKIIDTICKYIGSNYEMYDGIKEENIYSKMLNRYYLIFKNKYDMQLQNKINEFANSKSFISKIIDLSKDDELCVRYFVMYIINNSNNVIKDLNEFALEAFKNNIVCSGEIFRAAYDYDESSIVTLKNCCYFYYEICEYDIALQYLNLIENDLTYVSNMSEKIMHNRKKLNRVKYILRRIEFNVCKEQNISDLEEIISDNSINDEIISMIVDSAIINKKYIYNYIAIAFFEHEKYDRVIPYLTKAYEIDKNDLDTNYNLAYVLNFFGENKLALEYLSKLKVKNKEIIQLINQIKGA